MSIGVLGAATFAVIHFWPEKATRGTTNLRSFLNQKRRRKLSQIIVVCQMGQIQVRVNLSKAKRLTSRI